MTIGNKIQSLRKEKGLTQKELAQRLGVSASMVGQYETNIRKPKLETLEKFSEALNVSITEIIDISDISQSLNAAAPLIEKCRSIMDKGEPGETIVLSEEERSQIIEIAKLIGNVPDELEHSSFLINILRNEYISIFDKINLRGKFLAVKMVSDLEHNPENISCPFCRPEQ